MDLMQELRVQAEALQKQQANRAAKREEVIAAVDGAMARLFKYYHELLKHLEVVRPANPTNFVIPGVGSFEGLTFTESFIDFRKKRDRNIDLYDTVHFFIRWTSDENLTVERNNHAQVQRVRDALWTCNVRYTEDELRILGAAPRMVFTIPRNIVTDLVVQADHDNCALVIATRNLARLGPEDFTLPAREATKEGFDDLGRLLLGQRSNFAKYRTLHSKTGTGFTQPGAALTQPGVR
jgi:hypothetical protein